MYLKDKEIHQYIGEDDTKIIFKNLQTKQFVITDKSKFSSEGFKRLDFDPYRPSGSMRELSESELKTLIKVFPLYIVTTAERNAYFRNFFFDGHRSLPYFFRGLIVKDSLPYSMKQISIDLKIGDLSTVHYVYVPDLTVSNVVRLDLYGNKDKLSGATKK